MKSKSKPNPISVGDVFNTNEGGQCVVIEYRGCYDILIEHVDSHKHRAIVTTSQLRDGRIKNPYRPRIYGVGYIGVGNAVASENGKDTRPYATWSRMLERCYCPKKQSTNPSYIGCYVAPEWHNFQNFYSWYMSQEFCGSGYQLDKDILKRGNKVYCKEFCRLVPESINKVLGNNEAKRGDLPMGMQYRSGGYTVKLSCYGKIRYIGRFKDVDSAFRAYKLARESYIKELAEKNRGLMCEDIYNALINYEVRIDD